MTELRIKNGENLFKYVRFDLELNDNESFDGIEAIA